MAEFEKLNALLGEYAVPPASESSAPETKQSLHDLLGEYGNDATKELTAKNPVSTLGTYGETIAQAVKQTPAYIAQAIEGKTPFSERTKADETIESAQKSQEVFEKRPGAKSSVLGGFAEAEDVRKQAPSMASSFGGIIPTVVGGAIGGAATGAGAGPVGAGIGALAGGALSYIGMKRAAENQLIRSYVNKKEQEAGRPLSPQEKLAVQEEALASGEVEKYGHAEAGGELAGQAAEGLIALTPAGKILKGATSFVPTKVGKALAVGAGKALGITGTEIGTETGTQMFQQPVESKLGLTDEAPRELTSPSDWAESVKEVAKPTALTVLPMAGLGGITGGVQEYRTSGVKPATEEPSATPETPAAQQQPAAPETQNVDELPVTEDFAEVPTGTEQEPIIVSPKAEKTSQDAYESAADADKFASNFEEAKKQSEAANLKRYSDFVAEYEKKIAEGGIPTMVGAPLRNMARQAGVYDAKDTPDIMFEKLKAAVEAMKSPEQKIDEAGQQAREKLKDDIAAQYGDKPMSVVGKAATLAIDQGLSPEEGAARKQKEAEIAAQQQIEQPIDEIPAEQIDPETGEIRLNLEGQPDDTLKRIWLETGRTPEEKDQARQILESRRAATLAAQQPELQENQDASEIHSDTGIPESAGQVGQGSQSDSGSDLYQAGQEPAQGSEITAEGSRNIPATEEIITEQPTGEPNGEGPDKTTQTTSQEVAPIDAVAAQTEAAKAKVSDAQEQEGEYPKASLVISGIPVSVENSGVTKYHPAGSERKGVDENGKAWSVTLQDHYGEIRGTEAADGDAVDVFIVPGTTEVDKVYIVDQMKVGPDGKQKGFDEHKIIFGAKNLAEAKDVYRRNYSEGWNGLGAISAMPLDKFKQEWLTSDEAMKSPYSKKAADADAKTRATAPKVPRFKVKPIGQLTSRERLIYSTVAKKFGIPTKVVSGIAKASVEDLESRNKEGIYPLNTARIAEYGGTPRERYVEYVRRFAPDELTTSEAEDGIKTRQGSNYPQYLEWAKAGVQPPLISVSETENGNFQSSSRRRTLATQEAGKAINGWFSPINQETRYKYPLKYGDILDAIAETDADLRSSDIRNTDDLLTTINKLGGISRASAEGIDPAAYNMPVGDGVVPVFRATGGRTLDDLYNVLNDYGWQFKGSEELSQAVSQAVKSGEKVYNAEGSVRQAEKSAKEQVSDEENQARSDFLSEVDASNISQDDKDAFREDVLNGDFDPTRDYELLEKLKAEAETRDIDNIPFDTAEAPNIKHEENRDIGTVKSKFRDAVQKAYEEGDLDIPQYMVAQDMLSSKDPEVLKGLQKFIDNFMPGYGELQRVKAKGSVNVKRLLALVGSSMYKANLADTSIKEMVQNSFDAVKEQIAKNKSLKGQGKIDVLVDSSHRLIAIRDNGVGMTKKTILDAFLTVAGSNKEGLEAGDASGGFGMAKAAFLYGNEKIYLRTVHNGKLSTLEATGAELLDKGVDLATVPTDEPNGTTIIVKVPENVTINGEERYVYFPYGHKSIEFFQKPLLNDDVTISYNNNYVDLQELINGNAYENLSVNDAFDAAMAGGEIVPTGKNMDMSGYDKATTASFDWGSADIFIGKKRNKYPAHQILSAGVYQFDDSINLRGWEKVPYDILINVKPTVNADSANYPFNLKREGWKDLVEKDIGAMKAYIKQVAMGIEAQETVDVFKNIKAMPTIEVDDIGGETALNVSDFIPKKEVSAAKPSEVFTPPSVSISVGKVTGVDAKGETVTYVDVEAEKAKEKGGEASFKADKEAPTAKDFLLDFGIDPESPVYVNNTSFDFVENDPNIAVFFAELGNILMQAKRKVESLGLYGYKKLSDTPTFMGVSIDKQYHGVHVNVPFHGIFLNPLAVKGTKLPGIVAGLWETMVHEFTHIPEGNHDESFVMEYHNLSSKLAEDGFDIRMRVLLSKTLKKHKDSFLAARENYEASTTKNIARSLHEGENGTGVTSRRTEAARQGSVAGETTDSASALQKQRENRGGEGLQGNADLGVTGQFSRRAPTSQMDLFAESPGELSALQTKQQVADYAAQKDKKRQGNGAEPPPLFSDYPGFMGQTDIEDAQTSLEDTFKAMGKFDKAPENINHPDAERIRYVQDNFLDLLSELEKRQPSEFEIKC